MIQRNDKPKLNCVYMDVLFTQSLIKMWYLTCPDVSSVVSVYMYDEVITTYICFVLFFLRH